MRRTTLTSLLRVTVYAQLKHIYAQFSKLYAQLLLRIEPYIAHTPHYFAHRALGARYGNSANSAIQGRDHLGRPLPA
jgi:hypothetical protein